MRRTRPWITCALREWVVARLMETGDERTMDAVVDMPRWFIPFELGLQLGAGPSILYTAEHLDEINRAHREVLAGAKELKSRARSTAEKRRRSWREMLRRTAIDRARERVERRRTRAARMAG